MKNEWTVSELIAKCEAGKADCRPGSFGVPDENAGAGLDEIVTLRRIVRPDRAGGLMGINAEVVL